MVARCGHKKLITVDEIGEYHSRITITAWTVPNIITPILHFPVTFAYLIDESRLFGRSDF